MKELNWWPCHIWIGICHLKHLKGTILDMNRKRFLHKFLFVNDVLIPLAKFRLTSDMVREMSFEEFQDGCHGGHLGYGNKIILAIQNLHVTLMPPTKFRFNRT